MCRSSAEYGSPYPALRQAIPSRPKDVAGRAAAAVGERDADVAADVGPSLELKLEKYLEKLKKLSKMICSNFFDSETGLTYDFFSSSTHIPPA